ncbi:undecaprenyldiphospho-muramoylpentapeptide beta-N-acetylglucosaminyltransferase [Thermoleptolyngbya sp. M55_K2018_002]|uniref:undecaprenyldiphospho-muramoylpentapeptide beta-N-acetylglucosaminyltransferase n=1 Tax=Thermoleptolyngbya sp. M55_K2018_002 TaxID=2747808 RepID=UPI0019E5D8BE|nr:undecaprenyldiphospho-muramoylpentapeptide beta-N-acetylglucosaminyltransferase [Thermoleptolyngbya sp. M55_K2018_002]HIK42227.1 undecaprenyldiphospho-muramoylpentapeptide beta-N-acetylglucosaminyltransferase [Thermoleptolyngbya sp. M55_K2018_002]
MKLLIAASGTGGHLFPAIATAEQLSRHQTPYDIEWLGVPNRLETQLVPGKYPLHTIQVEGFQGKPGLGTLKTLARLLGSVVQVRSLLQKGNFQGVFTTGGYIAAPAILAARSLGLPTVLHESNALPGKVTRLLSPWCSVVAVGFEETIQRLPRAKAVHVGTPVRDAFRLAPSALPPLQLPIPDDVPLIVVVGGSQGAVAVNRLVRECAPAWFDAGFWLVHLTGDADPEAKSLSHPQYLALPFYDNMAALFHRATLAISRSGAGTLTELAIAHLPAILIPYPFAAEDHQTVNAAAFVRAGAAKVFQQKDLTSEMLTAEVLDLMRSPQRADMAKAAGRLAIADSAEQLAKLIQETVGR